MAQKKAIKDKIFVKGEYKGLMEITEETLAKKSLIAKKAMKIPTEKKFLGKVSKKTQNLTPKNCRNGDFDRCQNRCGACFYVSDATNIASMKVKKAILEPVLDMKAYMAQLPIHERRAVARN